MPLLLRYGYSDRGHGDRADVKCHAEQGGRIMNATDLRPYKGCSLQSSMSCQMRYE